MAIFIFNNGSGGHRGVWHLATRIKTTEVPEEIRENTYDVYDYHTRKCALNNPPPYRNYYEPAPKLICDCGHTGNPTGEKCILRNIHPAYSFRVVEEVACNQVGNLRAGDGLQYNRDFSKYYNTPGIHELVSEIQTKARFLYEGDDFPPGPICSRCKRKLDGEKFNGSTN